MWYYNNEVLDSIPEGAIGYVYSIENLVTCRKYIGKKNFYFAATKQVKGKKKRYKKESDWKTYYSSSEELKEDVLKLGTEFFKRDILRICYNKAEFSYYEAKYQFDCDCILKPKEYYNGWISVRVRREHLKKLIEKNNEKMAN